MKIFTNGCFDLLHIGHIELLKYSKSLGDYLVVGINSDNSVKKLKGSSRPINNELTRKIILESIKYVDEVIVFDEDTPIEIIKKIQPNIIVKGGDYKKENVVGYEFETIGLLEVKIFNYIENNSSYDDYKKSVLQLVDSLYMNSKNDSI
jgi:D-beta-D-heptose 7-phosphate kinase/D-beta-D-heptose 1-phosphate adenosyltransferase